MDPHVVATGVTLIVPSTATVSPDPIITPPNTLAVAMLNAIVTSPVPGFTPVEEDKYNPVPAITLVIKAEPDVVVFISLLIIFRGLI